MNTRHILMDLDKHASEFNFPVLDNAYVKFAAARLSAFCGLEDWSIIFEVLGFSVNETVFVNDLYAYGSCVGKEGFIAEEIPVSFSSDQPLLNPQTNECLADWSHWSISVYGKDMSFSPTRKEYADAGIVVGDEAGPGTLKEIDILRFLVHRLGANQLFLSDEKLLEHLPSCKGLSKFVQTLRWQHPDVADEEKPSEIVSIRTLLEAIARKDSSLFNEGRPNTNWEFWVQMT